MEERRSRRHLTINARAMVSVPSSRSQADPGGDFIRSPPGGNLPPPWRGRDFRRHGDQTLAADRTARTTFKSAQRQHRKIRVTATCAAARER
jgi:hypothetical protein